MSPPLIFDNFQKNLATGIGIRSRGKVAPCSAMFRASDVTFDRVRLYKLRNVCFSSNYKLCTAIIKYLPRDPQNSPSPLGAIQIIRDTLGGRGGGEGS